MRIAVIAKQVPDLVEGLEIDTSGKSIDWDSIRYIISEADDHALEQALLLKERHGATVEVFSVDVGEAREALMTAIAKGADRATLIGAEAEPARTSHAAARLFASLLRGLRFDLILTGVRAIDDLDGSLGGLLAGFLDLPYVGLVRKVEISGCAAIVQKEFPAGYATELEVRLPAVLGIQSAEQPPRYVPISRLRQVMKTARVEEETAAVTDGECALVERLFAPEEGAGATMLTGSVEEIAQRIAGLLVERHVVR